MNIYTELTNQFNKGRLRAILSSGQAVVLHRLAMMSKDGDWIIKEVDETSDYILSVLNRFGAHYRFGAPLDIRWLRGGWSAHFEFIFDALRIRTDFISRPPRISDERLMQLWMEQEGRAFPYVGLTDLAELKKTNREKDYAIIGELSRKMDLLESKIRYSRSARDLVGFYRNDPALVSGIMRERGIDVSALSNIEALEAALDAERRRLMHANEKRLKRYSLAAERWAEAWKEVEKEIASLSLMDAHKIIVERATAKLPYTPLEGGVYE